MELVEAMALYQDTQGAESLEAMRDQVEHYAEALAYLLSLGGAAFRLICDPDW
jgi:hypothetical protein